MEHSEFLTAIRQLDAAAKILVKAFPQDREFDAFQLLAFFRRYDNPGPGLRLPRIADRNDMTTFQGFLAEASTHGIGIRTSPSL